MANLMDLLRGTNDRDIELEIAQSASDPSEFSKHIAQRREETQRNALIRGATPLLAGFLFGGGAESAVETAKKGVEEEFNRDQKLADMETNYLMSALKAKDSKARGGGRTFQQAALEVDGKVVPAIFDQTLGVYKDMQGNPIKSSEVYKGYKKDVKTSPITGQLEAVSGQSLESSPIKGHEVKGLSESQRKELREAGKSLFSDKRFSTGRESSDAADRALEILYSKNPVGDAGLLTIFPRMFGEVGNLAAQEQARFSGSPEIVRVFERLKAKYSDGLLGEEDRSDLIKVAKVMGSYSKSLVNKAIDERVEFESTLDKTSKEALEKTLGKFRPKTSKVGKVAKKAEKESQKVEGVIIDRYHDGKHIKLKKTDKGWIKL